jgi:hypothetical protein
MDRRNSIIVFLILLLSYGYVFPRWADPNQNSRVNMVLAVVDDGTFIIDKYVANTVDYAKINGHYYSDKAPGAALLGMPVYYALREALRLPVMTQLTERLANSSAFQSTLRADGSGVNTDKVRFALAQIALALVTNAVPSALTGVLLYRLAARLTSRTAVRIAVALTWGLATPAVAYANAFYGHQLAAALLFGAFYLLWTRGSALSSRESLCVGFLCGYAVVTEFPAALIAIMLWGYALWQTRKQRVLMLPLTLAAAACAAGLMLYNDTVFGGPLELGYNNSELWTRQHSAGFMSLTMPHPEAMWGITFGLFRGLFVLSPVLLLAIPGLFIGLRDRAHRVEAWVATGAVLAMFLFNASSIMWWGGFAIGPRYLLPGLPFFVLGLIWVLRHANGWVIALFVLLAAASLVLTWGLTLADQAFPSDTLRNPLLEYALPNWQAGNIARNLGTLAGIKGPSSLVPLGIFAAILAVLFVGRPSEDAPTDARSRINQPRAGQWSRARVE